MENENTSTEEVNVETTAVTTNDESTESTEGLDEKAFASLMQKAVQDRINAQADEFAKTFLSEVVKQRAKAIDTGRPAHDPNREITKSFMNAVVNGDYAALKAMNTGSPQDGGVTVPKVLSTEIIRKANEEYGVARRVFSLRNKTGPGNTYQLYKEGDDAVAFWTNEGAKKSSSGITIDVIELGLKKLAVIIPWTDELMEDSELNLTEIITTSVARAMGKKEDAAFFNGTGTPYTGLFNDTNVNEVAIAGTNVKAFTLDDLQKVIDETPTEFADNGQWLMNRKALSVIRMMKDSNNNFLFTPAAQGNPATVLGYSVIVSDVAPSLATGGAGKPILAFGDFKRTAVVVTKGSLAVKFLDQATVYDTDNSTEINLAQQDMSALRFVQRVGFEIIQPEATTVLRTA